MEKGFHVLDDLPAYALGSLNAEESGLVADHLLGCLLCRTELEAYLSIADQLPLAVPEAKPSEGIKHRLFERVQSLSVKRQTQPSSQRKPSRPPGVQVGVFASLVVIAILAVSNILLWQKVNHPAFLAGPQGMRAIPLQNAGAAPDASGIVVVSADGLNGVLVVDQLPPLDPGHEYQAWLERNGESISGAVFSVDENGYRGVRIASTQSLLLYSGINITVEPVGGSTTPTGRQVLSGSLFNP